MNLENKYTPLTTKSDQVDSKRENNLYLYNTELETIQDLESASKAFDNSNLLAVDSHSNLETQREKMTNIDNQVQSTTTKLKSISQKIVRINFFNCCGRNVKYSIIFFEILAIVLFIIWKNLK
eukprot:GAHX01000467.1.p1 GENE.GAHX01000467.1~~GAHX01000467.1.p1  ORF type:complete len:136 (-),score=26.67 GAHX01000467.1:45-413(-)